MSPLPISACIVVRDEAPNIGACLDRLRFCDDRVVVDCGSVDDSVAIANGRGARVFVRDWPGMIAQKNRAVELARHDWVLAVDADERVTPELEASVRRLFPGPVGAPPASGYEMAWETWAFGGPVRSDRGRARWKLRLFDRRRGRWVGEDPHGHVRVQGRVDRLEGRLLHRTVRDLAHHVEKMNRYTSDAARVLAARRARALPGLVARAPWAFVRSWLLRGGLVDGARGFVVASLAATYVFVKYAKCLERRLEAGTPRAGDPSGPPGDAGSDPAGRAP